MIYVTSFTAYRSSLLITCACAWTQNKLVHKYAEKDVLTSKLFNECSAKNNFAMLTDNNQYAILPNRRLSKL